MNHICAITGASSGIGQACALVMAEKGCSLVLAGRNLSRLEETASKCREFGVPVEFVAGDVADPKLAESLFEKVGQLFDSGEVQPGLGLEDLTDQKIVLEKHAKGVTPKVSAIFAAGTAGFGDTLELPDLVWSETIAANLTGLFFSCREAIRFMKERGGGRIVNVLSVSSKTPFPKGAAYVASKFGGLGLTHSLSLEFRKQGIQFSAFMPGSVDTPLWDELEWTPERADMLSSKDVASAIADVVLSSAGGVFDEVVFMPQKGFL